MIIAFCWMLSRATYSGSSCFEIRICHQPETSFCGNALRKHRACRRPALYERVNWIHRGYCLQLFDQSWNCLRHRGSCCSARVQHIWKWCKLRSTRELLSQKPTATQCTAAVIKGSSAAPPPCVTHDNRHVHCKCFHSRPESIHPRQRQPTHKGHPV